MQCGDIYRLKTHIAALWKQSRLPRSHCCVDCPRQHDRPPLDTNEGSAVQTDFFKAATQCALTIVFAGFALTMTVFPKISFFPAFVAGFFLVLIMQRPGMVNFPTLFTCVVARLARESSIPATTFLFVSHSLAMASAIL